MGEVGRVAASNAIAAERQSGRAAGATAKWTWRLAQAELQGVKGYGTLSYLFNVPHFSD